MAALLAAMREPAFPATPTLVISNRPQAAGLGLAIAAGVPAIVIDHRAFGGDRGAHEVVIDRALRDAGTEIVCLAGYMRLLTPFLVNAWHGRMVNIHPGLLPAFPGLDTHARALAAGVKLHGCTVHLVGDSMDEGPILAQAAVPVLPDDTEATLAARVLRQEHRIYPPALASLATGQAVQSVSDRAALASLLPWEPGVP